MTPQSPRSRPLGRIGLLAALLALAVCVGGATIGFAASKDAGAGQRVLRGEAELQAKLEELQLRELQRQVELRSPEAAAARRRSRGLFGDLSASDALSLGGQAFPGALDSDVWTSLTDLPGGQDVDRYLGDFAARIARPGKPKAIVESTVPLRAEDEQGRKIPVDLTLRDHDGFLESANPLVPVRFHEDPAKGVTLERSGIGVALAGVDPSADGQEQSDRLAVANALPDTDYWTSPTPRGFETFAVLRSPESPEELTLDVDLPRGAELRQSPTGGATVTRDGDEVATITAPVANDADGRPVEVEMAVEGSQLVLSVPHRGEDVRYPLLVDPEFVEEWDWEYYDDEAATGWTGYTNHNGTFDWTYADLPHRWGSALYVFTHSGATVNNGDYGGWVFNPQGAASYVYRTDMWASHNGLNACMYRGINDGSAETNCSAVDYDSTAACVVWNCDSSAGGNDNWAYFRLQSTMTSVRSDATKAIAGLSAATVYYSDRDVPSFAAVNSGGTGTAWAQSYSGEVTGNVTDASLGMGAVELEVAGEAIDGSGNDCDGDAHDPCPTTLGTGLAFDSDALVESSFEGKHSVVLNAWDAVGNSSSTTWGNFWIDRSGPSLALSGSLWNGRVVTEPGTALTAASNHGLQIVATDGVQGGTAAQRRSGVKSVEVRVDGETVLAPNSVSCPPASTDSCPDTRNYTFSTGEFAAGRRTVEVVAIDQVGNKTTQSFDVIVPAAGELITPQAGDATSRWIQFEAHADNSALTTVKFQYRRPLQGWQNVPQTAMTDSQGQPVSTINHALTSGDSPVINWDVPVTWALLGAEPGPIDVRARFSDGSGPGGSSKTVRVTFDPRGLGTDNARSGIGPGSVDMLTGNFSYQSVDATVSSAAQDLSFSRSFNSRDTQANQSGPFGPGWVTSIPVSGVAEYANVREVDDATNGSYVELVLSDGGKVFFFPKPGGGYEPQTGAESLTLTKPASDTFEIDDSDGNNSEFVHQASAPTGQYDLTHVTTPGAGNTGTVTYDASGRVERITAPSPPGVNCISTTNSWNNRGCRSLSFTYATSTTATGTSEAQWGNYTGRLKEVEFKGWDGLGLSSGYPARFLYDSTGKLRAAWDGETSTARKTRYGYDAGGRLSQITPPGQPTWTLAYQQLAGDADGGRLKSVSRDTPQGTATSTVAYDVPVTGVSAPYQMGLSDVADWSQDDYATAATAIFPPDQVPADPPTSYSGATVHYMNRSGREVNTIVPGGATTTSEYDRYGNVVRELSPSNHARALASGGLSAQVAEALDVQRTYQDSGQELVDELGPEHEIKLENGSVVQARGHTVTAYDEGAPTDKNPHLPTTVTTSAQVVGGASAADVRVSKTEYDWTLLKPTKTIADHGGLALTRQFTYNSAGRPLTATMPKSGSGVRTTVYYSATGTGTCGSRPEWHGLPCQSYVSASGMSGDLPDPPVTTLTYNEHHQVLTSTREAGEQEVVTTNTYSDAGEQYTSQTTGHGALGGLVAAYGFEEATGTATTDRSGNGHDGVLENGAARVGEGRFGRGIKFDGTNDLVRVADSSSLDLTNLTLEAWVRTTTTSGTQPVVTRGSTTSGCTGPAYGMRASTGVSGAWCGTWKASSGLGSAMKPHLWSHVAVTRSGTNMRIYRNGQLYYNGSVSSSTMNDTADLLIGAGLGGYFSGVIDEVRVYNRALSQAEVQEDMTMPVIDGSKHPAGSQSSGLRAGYAFDERPTSDEIVDASGNGNDAELVGSRVTDGHHGAALVANGETIPWDESLHLDDELTASTWFAFDTSVSFYSAMPTTMVNAGGFDISYGGDGYVYFTVNLDSGSETISAWMTGTNGGVQVAGTFDGATMRLYLNGTLQASQAVSGDLEDWDYDITLGDWYVTSILDEVKIYDEALTSTELQTDKTVPLKDTYAVSSDGEPLGQTRTVYDADTGLPVEQRVTEGASTRSVYMDYDSVGRVTSYTDSEGNVSTTDYDLLGRPTEIDDGKGTQSFTYDSTTGLLEELEDSDAGTFTAEYDVEGKLLTQSYPNGLEAETSYDESGSPTALTYTKTTSCSSNCVWYDEEVKESIRGQWLERDSSLSDQDYVYDGAGRLTLVKDTPAGQGCTTRAYAFDANSNRTSMTTRAPGGGGACDTTSTGQVQSSTYDAIDRLTNAGIVYDTWGRVTTLPASHANGDELKTGYYINDMVRTQTQGAVSKGWLLDPTQGRYRATIPSGTTQEIYHYADGSDSPAWSEIKQNGVTQSWERSVAGIDGSLAATVSNDGSSTTTELQITNLHGDIIATADPDPAATALLDTFETDEFGNPRGGTTDRKHGYLGSKERRTVLDSGVIQMGVRSYVPAMGRFTSVDPVMGGSANDYDYANADPVNQMDLDGRKAKARRPKLKCANKKFSVDAVEDGKVSATVTQDITWCWRGKRLVSVDPRRTQSARNGWRAYGKWDTQRSYGPLRRSYRSTVSLQFEKCVPDISVGPISVGETCTRLTITSDVIVRPNSGFEVGPLTNVL